MAAKTSDSGSSPAISHEEFAGHLKHHSALSDSIDAVREKGYEEHGPGIDHDIPQDDLPQARPDLWWSRQRHRFREPLAEFFGVFILILFGDGYVAASLCHH